MSALDVDVGTVLFIRADRSWSHYPKVTNNLYTVVRRTPTQLLARNFYGTTEIRVRIKDGHVVGGSTWDTVQVATQAIITEHEAQAAERNRYVAAAAACHDLIDRPLHQLKLTTAQLEHLAKAWNEVKEMGGTNERT